MEIEEEEYYEYDEEDYEEEDELDDSSWKVRATALQFLQ
jgi:hypothetical protein